MSPFDGRWQKSTFSGGSGCVEVLFAAGAIQVRDTKDRGGPTLKFTPEEWYAFLQGAKNSEFDIEEPSS